MNAIEQEVAALERQRFDAQVSKDFDFLEKVFADDLIYTHSNGHQDDKTTYIQSIRSGQSCYNHIEVEALNVRVYHDGLAAVVNGTLLITLANNPDGTPNFTHLKYAVVQVLNPGKGWQVVLWLAQKQAT